MGKYAKIVLEVPDVKGYYFNDNIDYSNAATKKANILVLKSIIATDLPAIVKWGDVFEINKEIAIGFEAAESGGRNLSANQFGATGKWQMTANALAEAIPKWTVYQKVPMPSLAVNFMNSRAPFLMKLKKDEGLTSTQKSTITKLLKDDPEFNIMSGMLYLRWLLERFKYIGEPQLNKAMVAYNAGPYNSVITATKMPISTDALLKNKKVPLESRSYLLKLLGVYGFVDLIFKEDLL